jgi:hypothetical protein
MARTTSSTGVADVSAIRARSCARSRMGSIARSKRARSRPRSSNARFAWHTTADGLAPDPLSVRIVANADEKVFRWRERSRAGRRARSMRAPGPRSQAHWQGEPRQLHDPLDALPVVRRPVRTVDEHRRPPVAVAGPVAEHRLRGVLSCACTTRSSGFARQRRSRASGDELLAALQGTPQASERLIPSSRLTSESVASPRRIRLTCSR